MMARRASWLIRALWVFGLLGLAGCPKDSGEPSGGAAGGAPTSAGTTAHSGRNALRRTSPLTDMVDCAGVPTWLAAYEKIQGGQRVVSQGGLFECKPGLGAGWCTQKSYEPGTDDYFPPPYWWPDAWTQVGTCGESGTVGNHLTIKLPNKPTYGPVNASATPVTTRAGRAGKPLNGVLRCPREPDAEVALEADWGETLEIDNLIPCNYQLIMNAPDGLRPLRTPVVVAFTEPSNEHVTVEPTFTDPFPVALLKALPGVKVEVFATGVIQPRQMVLGNNVLYVGSSAIPNYVGDYGQIASFVYALPLDPATQRPTGEVRIITSNEVEPNGVAYRDGTLYFSTTGKLYKLADADHTYKDPHPTEVLNFPADDTKFPLPVETDVANSFRRWHQKHALYFNPTDPTDAALYTGIGTPCNICDMKPKDDRYGSLMSYNLTAGVGTRLAFGIRNSVGMDWNPDTKEIWFSDNNRQTDGQDPTEAVRYPEEVNRLDPAGKKNFGEPYVFGRKTIGYTVKEKANPALPNSPTGPLPGVLIGDLPPGLIHPADYDAPALELSPGAAVLDIKFLQASTYPGTGEGKGQTLLLAAHGGGSEGDGSPNVRVANIVDNKVMSVWPLIGGWRQDKVIGRPANFLVLPDHSLLIADDAANVIFRVTYDPSTLPGSALTLHMANAPDAGVKDDMPQGTLVDTAGTRWPFMLAWNGSTTLKGLAAGKYRLEMNEMGGFTPKDSPLEVEIGAAPATVELSYMEPPKLEAPITLKAPAKPAGADVPASMVVVVVTDNTPHEVSVPWGGQVVETLAYGSHEFLWPYVPHGMPVPSRSTFMVKTDAAHTETTAYTTVRNMGEAMLATAPDPATGAGGCAQCHDAKSLRDNVGAAISWSVEGREALRTRILSMSGRINNGHCDLTCAGEIADYLFDEEWAEYLKPMPSFGPRQLRKLTRDEYARSVKDTLHVDAVVDTLPADAADKYFVYPGQANQGTFDNAQVRAYYDEALAIAQKVDPAAIGYTAGTDTKVFVETLGHRIFRRPLTAAESTRYVALMGLQGETLDPPRRVVLGMLASPNFLYRSELGVKVGDTDEYRLTPDELATALAYGYLGTTPGDALLKKAEDGKLETGAEVAAEIKAMTATAQGKDQFLRFIRYYTRTTLPPAVKEGLDQQLANDMWEEQALFVRSVLGRADGTFGLLLNPGYTFLNARLAAHYGIANVTSPTFAQVALNGVDAERWGGLLQQGAFLASRASSNANTAAMVRRGFTVRENMLCRKFATQENDNRPVEYPNVAVSTRQHWALMHQGIPGGTQKTCWACHQFVNDLGASMEHYDQTASFRTQEHAVNPGFTDKLVDIDSSGPLISNGGQTRWADFKDVRGVSEELADQTQAKQCLADSYYRFLYGAEAGSQGLKLVNEVADGLTKGTLETMLVKLGSDDAMRLRKETPAPPASRAVPATAEAVSAAHVLHWPTPTQRSVLP